jgi:CheY-like chemotaxis protein
MEAPEWREESDGTFIAETARVSLVVCRLADRRHARFLVMARRAAGSDVLVGSGTTESLGQAMQEAEKAAHRSPNATDRIRTLVIVVDDNNAARSAVANTLRDGGYQVAEVSSGEGALRRLERTTQPAVMVADINLGAGMSGLQLAASVHELWPATGVVLISADDDMLAAHAAEDEILAKPFSTDRLLGRVDAVAARLKPSAPFNLNKQIRRAF